jgi:L,D-transpeptidase ErfK/SrfK
MKIKNYLTCASALLLFISMHCAVAETYTTPADTSAIVGSSRYITSSSNETLITIAQNFDIGLNAILLANPGVPATTPVASNIPISIPTSHLLPPVTRSGIVINLPEMRLYYYLPNGIVKTYPIGIGRIGKTIPLSRTIVVRKAKNPIWIPPEDIRAFNKDQGIDLPHIMQPGPDNPLGPYAIYLKIPTYLIHSTIYPDSVGTRASFGCIRMHETDIQDFFPLVTAHTPVTIIDMPNKVGWEENNLFLETHTPLEEHAQEIYAKYAGVINSIENATEHKPTMIDWQMVADLVEFRDGTPHEIGFALTPS